MKTLAIVGTGIAGMGCAWFLHSRFEVTLFEQNDYVGGHTNTVTVDEAGRPVPIDTGFMVFNHVTYPLLTRLFRELDVATKPTEMSFSVQHCPSGLEYNGGNVGLLFGQRRNWLNLRHWRMLLAIDRFNREAREALNDPRFAHDTLDEYIRRRGYGADMLERYLIPMSSSVWSTPPDRMREFPAMTLLRFWQNHGFLGLDARHPWFTVVNGSRSYVEKITAPIRDRIQRNQKVVRVAEIDGQAELTLADGSRCRFDKVILAGHADQMLGILVDPTEREAGLLRPFKYQSNTVTLHSDESFMPKTRRCWASWNYRLDGGTDAETKATVHYWMNSLQHVSDRQNYFVSLNCEERIRPDRILKRLRYEHPLFDLAAVRAQAELPELNRRSREQTRYYAGAWFKYGFHEDGLASALDCARAVAGEEVWA